MTYICQVCGDPCDEYGNRTESSREQNRPVSLRTCIPCRLEAIRVRKFGPDNRKNREASLPYKD